MDYLVEYYNNQNVNLEGVGYAEEEIKEYLEPDEYQELQDKGVVKLTRQDEGWDGVAYAIIRKL
jgi:hypothetical protein